MTRWSDHPSVSIVNGEPRLRIFRNLKLDPTLPKHLVDGMVMTRHGGMTVEEYLKSPDGMSRYRREEYGMSDSGDAVTREKWTSRFIRWLSSLFKTREIPPETFRRAHDMLARNVISDDIEKAAAQLKSLVEKTRANGQGTLAARLEDEHRAIIAETVLKKNGFHSYLTEKDAIELLQKSRAGIRIDFWNDYPDIVPESVLETKRKADALRVFDNWCVMHYDPDGSALRQMKDEEWRRDPILFGLVVGSDRLYFVSDWTTGTDDLTVDKVCRMLGLPCLRVAGDYGGKTYGIVDAVMAEPGDDLITNVTIDPRP